jgi:TPR repeat protein
MNFVQAHRQRLLVVSIAVASILLIAMPGMASAQSAAALRCDELAASRYDPATPAGKGVAFNQLDADAAIAACTAALETTPDDAKLRFQLGRALDKAGRGPEAVAAFEAAAAGGSSLALSGLGTLYDGGYGVPEDAAKALRYYQEAADAGLPLAMVNLGALYEGGRGVPQDYAKAAELYKQATDAGSGFGAATLGLLYEKGLGVDQDMAEAVRLYRIGADAGEDFALRNMGVMYANGYGGLAKDDTEAFRYYMLSADAKFPPAYIDVGLAHEKGLGTLADSAKAETWFRMAIAEGDAQTKGDGQNNLAWLYAIENRQLEEAETLSRQAVAALPEDANRLDTLAWILHQQGRDAEALPIMEKAMELEPDRASFAEHLAAIKE